MDAMAWLHCIACSHLLRALLHCTALLRAGRSMLSAVHGVPSDPSVREATSPGSLAPPRILP